MKFEFKNISEHRVKELYNYKELPIEVITPRFQKITTHAHEHVLMFATTYNDESWVFLAIIEVNDKRCNVIIEANRFFVENSYQYRGVTDLVIDIDTEDNIIYYFQELASKAIVNYVLEGTSEEFKEEFNNNFLINTG